MVILISSSCLSSTTSAESLPHFGHSKTWFLLLQRKHEIFDVSSFLSFPFSPKVVGMSRLGALSRPLSRTLLSWVFLLCPFENSLLNPMNDSAASITKERSCTLHILNSILAHPWRLSRNQKSASYFPILWISKSSSWNSFTCSWIYPSLCQKVVEVWS